MDETLIERVLTLENHVIALAERLSALERLNETAYGKRWVAENAAASGITEKVNESASEL